MANLDKIRKDTLMIAEIKIVNIVVMVLKARH